MEAKGGKRRGDLLRRAEKVWHNEEKTAAHKQAGNTGSPSGTMWKGSVLI